VKLIKPRKKEKKEGKEKNREPKKSTRRDGGLTVNKTNI
jgi:hypothetical protein